MIDIAALVLLEATIMCKMYDMKIFHVKKFGVEISQPGQRALEQLCSWLALYRLRKEFQYQSQYV